ncbi:DUF6894 family protein, partial [Methylobacterium sp. J-070]|uniref:DUF6894 family protein n=1 Tax=Methylobacterium sp. J-070 TaxID=2836650 RepID=UPI00391A843A
MDLENTRQRCAGQADRFSIARGRMPRQFFDVLHDGEDVTRDDDGVDLPNLEAAEIEALEI